MRDWQERIESLGCTLIDDGLIIQYEPEDNSSECIKLEWPRNKLKQVEFYKSLANMEERECIEKLLIYNISLVISGIKPSATIIIKKTKKIYIING